MGAYDLGELGPAQAVSSGLQGLLEAYKLKLASAQEEAKLRQSAFNVHQADPNAAMMSMMKIIETNRHNEETEKLAGGGGAPAIIARDILNGKFDPSQIPKRGALYSQVINELDKQSKGNEDLISASNAAKSKMFESGPTAQRVQRSSEALGPLVEALKTSLGYNPETGVYDKPTTQSAYPAMNVAKSFWGKNFRGSDPRKDVKANATAITKELNMMAQNGGSDKNLAMAMEMIDPNSSPQDMQTGIDAAERMAGGRSEAYGGNPLIQKVRGMTPTGRANPGAVPDQGGWEPSSYRGKPAKRRRISPTEWEYEVDD